MEERILVMADGTKLKRCECGYYSAVLWVKFRGITMKKAFSIAGNPKKTAKIEFFVGEQLISSFEGFTEIVAMNTVEDVISVGLVKPREEEE